MYLLCFTVQDFFTCCSFFFLIHWDFRVFGKIFGWFFLKLDCFFISKDFIFLLLSFLWEKVKGNIRVIWCVQMIFWICQNILIKNINIKQPLEITEKIHINQRFYGNWFSWFEVTDWKRFYAWFRFHWRNSEARLNSLRAFIIVINSHQNPSEVQ